MAHKDKTETIRYRCSKLGGEVNLKSTIRSFYENELNEPIDQAIVKQDCSGRLECGITPKLSPTSFGQTDWSKCEYLINLQNSQE